MGSDNHSTRTLQLTQQLNKTRSQLEQEKAENAHLQVDINWVHGA